MGDLHRLRVEIHRATRRILSNGRPKIFCIGRNKTGTTSLAATFTQLGYRVGDQVSAEWIFHEDYFRGETDRLIDYCRTAEVFQDVPFSAPGTYRVMDHAFPGSKFILTVRDSPEQWYESLVRFHSKMFGNGRTPTAHDLRLADYRTRGFAYNSVRLYGTSDANPYDEAALIEHYKQYNSDVQEYFRERPRDLLVLNLGSENSMSQFLDFIGEQDASLDRFPHLNRSN